MHTHMPYATALSVLEDTGLEPVDQNALRFYGDVAYDSGYAGLALARDEGERLASELGDKRVLFMSNHGVLVAGETIAEAFNDLYYLERAC
jgi:ribulose-5-phosphate 4-epimerase/fuculose-1-phosphate aldolase